MANIYPGIILHCILSNCSLCIHLIGSFDMNYLKICSHKIVACVYQSYQHEYKESKLSKQLMGQINSYKACFSNQK